MIRALGRTRLSGCLAAIALAAFLGCATPAQPPAPATQVPPAQTPAAQAPAARVPTAQSPAGQVPAPQTAAAQVAPSIAPPANDLLNAVLWMQRSVEYKASTVSAFALARIRLEQALADPNWTAAPKEQTGAYQALPPAVVLDVDESIVDNSAYQAWMTMNDTSFDPKTWNAYVNTVTSLAIPGAVEFARYADSRGVKVFYISNRTAEEEPATRKNLEKLGFPMGGDVDTMLMTRKQPDWGSAKGTRRAYIAKTYRILLNVGDNFGDFVDEYRGTEAERLKVFEQYKDRWGREWIMIANPSYGSFESAPFNHDFKLSNDERRKAKRGVLDAWPGP